MVSTKNKAKPLSSVNHTTKTIQSIKLKSVVLMLLCLCCQLHKLARLNTSARKYTAWK